MTFAVVTWTFDQLIEIGERLGIPTFLFILCGLGVWKVYKGTTGFFGPMVKTGFEKHIDFLERTAKMAEQSAETSRHQTALMRSVVEGQRESNAQNKQLVDKVTTTSDKIVIAQEKLLVTQQKLSTENVQIIQGLKDLKDGNGITAGARLVTPPRIPEDPNPQ